MRFDLFFEVSRPPQLARSETEVYRDGLAEIELADRLGFGCAWLVERHFTPGYSYSSKPELLLAAAAARTHRIRIGHAVIPLPLHHPVHVAEQIAALDVLSGDRLEVSVGRGVSPREYAAFGVRLEDSRALTDEMLEILRLSFAGGPLTHAGRHYRLNGLRLAPQPVQQPHPPLWAAAVSPGTFVWAAERRLGVLAGPFKPWFMVQHDIARYRAAWQHDEAPRIGMTVGILCLNDSRRAHRLATDAFKWFYSALYQAALPVLEKLYPSYEQLHELGRFRALLKLGVSLGLAKTFGMAVVGDPGECVEKLGKYRAAGITHLLCAVGAGTLDTETTQESLACLAEHVLPALS